MIDLGDDAREYFTIGKAAERIGCEIEHLVHAGARGKVPVYVMAKDWTGLAFELHVKPGTDELQSPRRPTRLIDLIQVWPGTLQFFEDGTESVLLKSLLLKDDPDYKNRTQVDLDNPVEISRSQLILKAADVNAFKANVADTKSAVAAVAASDGSSAVDSVGKREQNKRKTQEQYRLWQRKVDEMKQKHPGKSKKYIVELVDAEQKKTTVSRKSRFRTIYNNTKV
jgi:hypothetical protein